MSFSGDPRHTPAAPHLSADLRIPLTNLSTVQARMDILHKFLSDSVNTNTPLVKPQIDTVSSEIAAAIHQIVVNGAALLSCAPSIEHQYDKAKPLFHPDPAKLGTDLADPKDKEDESGGDFEIIEMDAVELLAEHVHFCEICGKGFKRDANLRMHMRAHGNQFKTVEALAKPERVAGGGDLVGDGRRLRFSCPYVGCNRNKRHRKFRALKSAICVKNHFKRSHCPKMFSCNRCNKKSFAVVADLRSHLKHCGDAKWRCSCGTSFSRKDKLFGHMALFEGHMPAVVEEEEKGRSTAVVVVEDEEMNLDYQWEMVQKLEREFDGFSDGFLDGSGSIENYCFEDVLSWTNTNNTLNREE